MKKSFLALLAGIALTAGGQNPADSIAQTRCLEQVALADSAVSIGDWATAESALQAAMAAQPANPANLLLLSNLGMIQFYQGKDSAALETLNTAAAIAPRTVPVLANRMTVLDAMGLTDLAADDANTILRIDSANIKAHLYLFDNSIRRTDFAAAKERLDTLLSIAPDNSMTIIAEATYFTSTGQYTLAISPLSRMIEQNPRAEYYAARAHCRLMTQDLNDASADIAEGLRLDPALGELYLYRALLNKMRYRSDDARTDALRAIRLGVDPARALPLTK